MRRPRAVQLLLLGLLATIVLAAVPIEFDPLPLGEETEPEVTAAPAVPAEPLEGLETTVDIEDWERVADCESGRWEDGDPEPDSARWDYGLESDGDDHFQGGLNFHPDTWEAFRDPDMPAHAGRATRREEIEVAEEVLDEQGWDAWPVCSEMMGLDE